MNTTGKSGFTPRSNMPAFGAFGTQQPASLMFEKSNPGLRRSTPDSEALASSDDEVDQVRAAAAASQKLPKPTRRTSWLNDVSAANSTLNRKPSATAQYSPSASNPGTPGADQPSWTSLANPSTVAWNNAPTSSPWGSIWSQDTRNPPSRLQEVMANQDGGIPFSIPLQPTPKTYRSQSYSVGQLDASSSIPNPGQMSTAADQSRARLGSQNPSLQRRTSRTSGLGLDSGGLGRVREVDDDEEEVANLNQSADMYNHSQARQIARLEQETAMLRHANQARDHILPPTTSAAASTNPAFRGSRLHGSVPEEFDNAVDDQESMSGSGTLPRRENGLRRMSEQAGLSFDRHDLTPPEIRAHENTRKTQWSTALGFGSIPEAPQSRRHSLADVPTRHGSFSSHGRNPSRPRLSSIGTDIAVEEHEVPTYDSLSQDLGSQGDDRESTTLALIVPSQSMMENEYLRARAIAAAYFATTDMTRRAAEAHVQSSYMNPANPYSSPHSHLGTYMGPASQPLHIVNFKCCRSDVFYVQDGTGLQVNVGDLVIVEADRGTDLGTVQHVNVTWDEARRYKEHYAEEHYKWLMMFSQQSRNGGPNVLNPNGLPSKPPGSAVGGMGPPSHGVGGGGHESSAAGHGELKPKMIKRLAQNHEIQTLKDKEGNEAKAKRNCQQKVMEHRLNMEILDAEFQMDGKKLTFYYFADSYINFNSLVTDLFKVYKTRIWMSAINPASFQTPTSSLGLQPAFGLGHNLNLGGGVGGGTGSGRDTHSPVTAGGSGGSRRRQQGHAQAQPQSQAQPAYLQNHSVHQLPFAPNDFPDHSDRFNISLNAPPAPQDQGSIAAISGIGIRSGFLNHFPPPLSHHQQQAHSPFGATSMSPFGNTQHDHMDPFGQYAFQPQSQGYAQPQAFAHSPGHAGFPGMLNPNAPNFSVSGAAGGGGGRLGSRGASSHGQGSRGNTLVNESGSGNASPAGGGNEWVGRFQGLSLGSH